MAKQPVQFKVPNISSSSSTYSFENGFAGGMNISVAADQIAPNQSPNMSDCDYSGGGVPTKRVGLSLVSGISLGATPIRHMVELPLIGGETEFLIIHGGNLYKVNE